MKKETKVLLSKSIDSLFLAVEHFNRPWDRGRPEAVLVLLDRSFELLLKAVIVHRGGKIRERRANETIGFDSCVRKCVSDSKLRCFAEEEAITIQVINSLRDAAQHYFLEISEQQLYIYAQSGLTLYDNVFTTVFHEPLKKYLPHRVLPITTELPKDLATVITAEFEDIKAFLAPSMRKQLEAKARLRTLQIVEDSLSGRRSQPGEPELRRLVRKVCKGTSWQTIFPVLASLQLDATGTGLSVSLRITKHNGEPIQLVPEGTPGATVVAIKRVNELSYYSLGLVDIAKKLGLTNNKMLAVVKELNIQNNYDYFKVFKIGKSTHKRYSNKCLEYLQKALPNLDLDDIWKKYVNKKSGKSKLHSSSLAELQ